MLTTGVGTQLPQVRPETARDTLQYFIDETTPVHRLHSQRAPWACSPRQTWARGNRPQSCCVELGIRSRSTALVRRRMKRSVQRNGQETTGQETTTTETRVRVMETR